MTPLCLEPVTPLYQAKRSTILLSQRSLSGQTKPFRQYLKPVRANSVRHDNSSWAQHTGVVGSSLLDHSSTVSPPPYHSSPCLLTNIHPQYRQRVSKKDTSTRLGPPASSRLQARVFGSRAGKKMSSQVRVVTYNVLSSSLASPGYFTHCKPEDLNASTRYRRLKERLQEEIRAGSIVCLQEVSLRWAGRLTTFFHRKGYKFLQTQYGSYHSDFMGIGIAFPTQSYSLEDCEMIRLTDMVDWQREPRQNLNLALWLAKLPMSAMEYLSRTVPFLGYKKQQDWLQTAKFRSNRILALKLRCLATNRMFMIGTYHMPCMPGKEKIMLTHAALAVQFIQSRAENLPYILPGDWNMLPESDPYKHLVEGKCGIELDLPEWETWRPDLKHTVRSAYKEYLGTEPEFTNNAKVREEPSFVGTLDYIFMSEGWVVTTVGDLPKRETIVGPYPDGNEPSDHLMLTATFKEVPRTSFN